MAVVRSRSSAPARSALCTWNAASYFAPIGQMGMQVALPQHAGRPWWVTELRACGVGRTWYGESRSARANTWSK